nr:FecR domain-containing protein [Paenibacillus soyae]
MLAFFIVMTLIPASAFALASERSATILEAGGGVTVRIAGGYASYPAYAGMRLHEGDTIETGEGAHAIIQVDDRKDRITLGEHGELFLSDLKSQGKAAITRFALLSGSAWSHVEPRTGHTAGERFEIRTGTAVLTAKGTYFMTIINKKTGETTMVVAAGIVSAASPTENESANRSQEENKTVFVYPAQQINLDSREVRELRAKVEFIDIKKLIDEIPPKVIESIVKDHEEIVKENEQWAEQLREQLEAGVMRPSELANFQIRDLTDLNKVTANLDNLVGNIAKQAIDAHKIEQKTIDEANKKVDDPLKKIDLSKVEQLDRTAGLDPEVEALKQAAQDGTQRLLEEQRQLLENQQRLASLLQKIEADKKKLDETNRKAAEDESSKAEERLKEQLDEAARKAYEENKRKNEQSSSGQSGTTPPATSSPSPGSPPSNIDKEETLVLRDAISDGKTVTASLYLGGFDQPDESIYAVEVQLLYDDSRLSYHGKNIVSPSSGTVFGALPNSLELLRQPPTWGENATLYYAAAVSGVAGSNAAPLFVADEKLLVSIPLQLMNTNDEGLVIQLAYFKVLDKDGNVLLDGSHLADDPIKVAVRPATESR